MVKECHSLCDLLLQLLLYFKKIIILDKATDEFAKLVSSFVHRVIRFK
jgi:hypothetical protein